MAEMSNDDIQNLLDSCRQDAVPPSQEPQDLPKFETIPDGDLTQEQRNAIAKTLDWYNNSSRQILTVGGYAGTGKTTIAKKILQGFGKNVKVAVVAFTGKAVAVLRRKGLTTAQTLHSLIYERTGDDAQGRPVFRRLKHLPYDIVLVDEASQISAEMHRDIKSFGVRILYIGDHGQLEPIGEDPGLMSNPDITLEEPHRFARQSDLWKFSEKLRNGMSVFPHYESSEVTIASATDFWQAAIEADVAIVGFNKTRHRTNQIIREHRGFNGLLPTEGERVICLRNSRNYGVYNGLTATINRVRRTAGDLHYIDIEDDVGNRWKNLASFTRQYGQNSMAGELRMRRDNFLLFDFGYTLTCHKSQGSEWDDVAVKEEIASTWDPSRWRYTAWTRACNRQRWHR